MCVFVYSGKKSFISSPIDDLFNFRIAANSIPIKKQTNGPESIYSRTFDVFLNCIYLFNRLNKSLMIWLTVAEYDFGYSEKKNKTTNDDDSFDGSLPIYRVLYDYVVSDERSRRIHNNITIIHIIRRIIMYAIYYLVQACVYIKSGWRLHDFHFVGVCIHCITLSYNLYIYCFE